MDFIYAFLSLLCLIRSGFTRDCTDKDIKTYVMPCNTITQKHKVVSYLNSTDCALKDTKLIKPTYETPCTCPPGKGLNDKHLCEKCKAGSFSAGGEDISDWASWTENGTKPLPETGINTFCEIYRSYVKPCEHWKASYFNDSLESGENSKTRCMSSILMMRKQFVGTDNYVKFTYRVEGRKCHSNYIGCDGLSFYVDNKQVMPFIGNQFVWKTLRFNVTAGYHQLKWTYRKNCYSFPTRGLADKAFLQSITLVGTTSPHTKCKPCPPGTYSTKDGATECQKCHYFQYQPSSGKTSCNACQPNMYSMLGSAYCVPMMKCDKNDVVNAPDPLSTCKKVGKVYKRYLVPTYASVEIDGKKHTLCKPPTVKLNKTQVPCNCQPGYEFTGPNCSKCTKGKYSTSGEKCQNCPSGHVALMGKHVYTWTKGKLPDGFKANCVGDCSEKNGWYSSGDHVRTYRVVGDVDSYIESGQYKVVSNIAYIKFSCSILCNVTKRTTSLSGNHLADIQYCNLVFEVWTNGSLTDQVNCTKPKGKYIYRHERSRDGKIIAHYMSLDKGAYRFRWVFHQADELRSVSAAFEARVFNISIVGIEGGSAQSCSPCQPGYKSVPDNTDCSICPNGTYSPSGSAECIPCKENTFADTPGSGECLPCGANTKSLPNRDGCTNNDCKFTSKPGVVEYDLSQLSRENGPMFEVLHYQPKIFRRPDFRRYNTKRSISSVKRLSISPPYRTQFWVNLCTVKHENNTCTIRASNFGPRKSLPVMGCRTSWWSRRDTSIGRVMSFKAKKDIRSGVVVQLLHGDRCGKQRYNTTIDLTCDVDAGVGNPGPENNYTQIFRPPCTYYFKWRSLYACPKCRREDFEKVTHPCINGTANVTIMRKVPCWGQLDGMEAGVSQVNCSSRIFIHDAVKTSRMSAVNKVLIGLGVVIIVALIIIAVYFFCKHRDLKYKYYSTFARNKPMSKLEEEEEDFGQIEGDVFNDTRNMIRS